MFSLNWSDCYHANCLVLTKEGDFKGGSHIKFQTILTGAALVVMIESPSHVNQCFQEMSDK